MEDPDNKTLMQQKTRKWPQVLAALVAGLGTFGTGTSLAWSAPAIPNIQEEICAPLLECDVGGPASGITEEEASWVGALMPGGAIFSGVVAGWLLGAVGRRWTMAVCSVPYLVGCALYVASYEVGKEEGAEDKGAQWMIYTGRLLTGFSGGAFFFVAPIYVMETSEPQIRGQLAALAITMAPLGLAFTNGLSIEDAVHWNAISAILIAVPVLMFVMLPFLPESPRYLISRGKNEEASKALKFLRGPDFDPAEELESLQLANEQDLRIGRVSISDFLTKRVYVLPLLLVLVVMFVQQFGGINVVNFYVQVIFEDAGSDMDPGLSGFLVSLAQFLGNIVAVFIVEKFGRRFLLVISTAIMGASLFSLGTFFYIKENQTVQCQDSEIVFGLCEPQDGKFSAQTVEDLGWLPLVSLVIYEVGFALGMGPLPFAVNAEIFLPEARPVAAPLAATFNWICSFLVTKFNSNLEDSLHTYGTYFMYASICIVGAIVIQLFLPETKGKSPQELAQKFDKWKGVKS